MKALLLTNGELYQSDVLGKRIGTQIFNLVIGVDGGARYADTLKVTLDVIVGDLDSLSGFKQRSGTVPEIVSYPEEKDETDLELALVYARKRGVDHMVMVGVMGGRMDMTIANTMLLSHRGLGSCQIEIWHGQETGWIIKPPGDNIAGEPGDIVSFIPLGSDVSNVITRGFKYPLRDEELPLGGMRGVSNVINKTPARIEFSEGILLAVHTPSFENKVRRGSHV